MADAPVLGAGSPECGFKSHLPHLEKPSIVLFGRLGFFVTFFAREEPMLLKNKT